jgi:hypothetical protein
MTNTHEQTRLANAIADAAVNYLNTYWSSVNGVAARSGGNR